MTKPRAPLTLEKALVRIADVLPGGFDDMAEATNRSAWHVRAWADPDRREQIALRDALLLDRACRDAGGGTPIAEFYAARLRTGVSSLPSTAADIANHATAAVRECSEAVAALIEATQSEAGRAKAPTELLEAIEALSRALTAVMGRDAFAALFGNDPPDPHATGPPH